MGWSHGLGLEIIGAQARFSAKGPAPWTPATRNGATSERTTSRRWAWESPRNRGVRLHSRQYTSIRRAAPGIGVQPQPSHGKWLVFTPIPLFVLKRTAARELPQASGSTGRASSPGSLSQAAFALLPLRTHITPTSTLPISPSHLRFFRIDCPVARVSRLSAVQEVVDALVWWRRSSRQRVERGAPETGALIGHDRLVQMFPLRPCRSGLPVAAAALVMLAVSREAPVPARSRARCAETARVAGNELLRRQVEANWLLSVPA